MSWLSKELQYMACCSYISTVYKTALKDCLKVKME